MQRTRNTIRATLLYVTENNFYIAAVSVIELYAHQWNDELQLFCVKKADLQNHQGKELFLKDTAIGKL